MKKPKAYTNVCERYGDPVRLTLDEFRAACAANGWTVPMLREAADGSLVSATTGEAILVPVRPGRPRKSLEGQVVRVACYVTPDVYRKLESLAKKSGESLGALAARVLTKHAR